MAVARPEESALFAFVFWLLLAALLAGPFWFPVVVADRLGTIAGVLRLGSLVGLVLVSLVAGHQFYFDIDRSLQGQEVTFLELFLDAFVAVVSAASVFIVYKSKPQRMGNDT